MPTRDRKAVSVNRTVDLITLPPEQAKDFLASRLESNTKEGVLLLSNVPCVIIRPEAIVNIQKQLEGTIGGSSKGILYLSGERSARSGMNLFESIVSTEAPMTLANARRLMEASALVGWGRPEISEFDPEHGRLLLTITNSPLARAYGASKKSVCHFLAGWIAGIGRNLLECDVLCEETACAAQGYDRCEFELRPLGRPM
jgi:predicted hydrocarbon binding protein